jgi:hypothetical protein
MEGRFKGRDIFDKPYCPFCGGMIERPRELLIRRPTEMPVGRCACGAVYACDVTGHNLGTAMIEALVVSCDGDWDRAFDLLPEDDYVTDQVDHYDIETHLVVHGGAYEGRQINGSLYFIRLHEDIREVTDEGARRLIDKAPPLLKKASRHGRRAFSKKQVEALVAEYQIETLLDMAGQDKRIIRDLQRLLYSVDPLISRRAAEMMGKASARIARDDSGFVSRSLQGLFTAITDTAASGWGYIHAIGEIIAHNPGQLAGYVPELYRLMGDAALLPEVLEALTKIAEQRADIVRKMSHRLIPLLQDPNPEIRGHAVMVLGHMRLPEINADLLRLQKDTETIQCYKNGLIETHTIGQLAVQALEET